MSQLFLRTTKTDGKAPLYVRTRRKGILFCVSTGIMVDVKEWNKSLKSKSALVKYESSEEGMRVLDMERKVFLAIDQLYDDNKLNSKDDKPILEKALSDIVNTEVPVFVPDTEVNDESLKYVKAFYANFFNGITNGTIRHGSNAKYSDGSIQIWKNFGKSLHAYCPNDIPFSEITKPFADRFSLFLEKKGMMPNTVNKYVTCFRKLCNLAAEEGYNTNAVSLKVWKERTVKEVEKRAEIYLTDEEIDAMYGMKLEGMEEMVRDVFLLGYFSCQRYSDYSKLREENFITYDTGLGVISLTQKKTGNVVNVPIVDKCVNELCEKYHYDFPVLTEQQMNVKIKVVAEKLSKDVPSLQEKFVTVLTAVERRAEDTYAKLLKKKKSGKKLTENERKWYYKQHKLAESHNGNPLWERNKHGEVIRPKYELVSSHTSRRSGTTNLYKMGVLSSKEMRSITGHQSEKVFEKYIRVGISEQAQIVADKLLAAKKAKNGKVEK